MEIKIQLQDPAKKRPKPADESKLVFGKVFSDHMFLMDYRAGQGWMDPRIVPYQNLQLDPSAMVLHYGQGIFEGLKAYRWKDGSIHLFRPRKNYARFNRSAEKMCMPQIDEAFHYKLVETIVGIDKDWVPHSKGSSLYLRPTMIASEPHLGVRPASEYIYFFITGPVAAYYAEGFNPVTIYVTDEFVRSVEGGLGEAKTMANYAASLYAAEYAKKKGFTQVLWLDGVQRRYIEEVGTMNIFFRLKDELITPPLHGTILPGITRESVIEMATHWGIKVSERPITIDEVIETVQSGEMKEIFGTGTAAVISPVGLVSYKEKSYKVQDGSVGEYALKLYDEIVGIQYGEKEDPYGWVSHLDI